MSRGAVCETTQAERMGLQATWNRARDAGSPGSEQAGMTGEGTQHKHAQSQILHTNTDTQSKIKKRD